jgi:hypothetical protein
MLSQLRLSPGRFSLLMLCITLVGCGGKGATAKVSGQVKFFDKNLTCGTVAFTSADGRVGTANIDFDGNYEMGNAPVGEVTITVSVPQAAAGKMGASGPPKPPPGVPEMRPPGEQGGIGGTATPSIDPSKIVQIPKKYERGDTSGLKYTVEKGPQTHNITLSP